MQDGKYAEAFAAFKAMDEDAHPDVANYLGYTARKLGDYDLSKVWYERALESDPKHVRTWQYYGMWQSRRATSSRARLLEQSADRARSAGIPDSRAAGSTVRTAAHAGREHGGA